MIPYLKFLFCHSDRHCLNSDSNTEPPLSISPPVPQAMNCCCIIISSCSGSYLNNAGLPSRIISPKISNNPISSTNTHDGEPPLIAVTLGLSTWNIEAPPSSLPFLSPFFSMFINEAVQFFTSCDINAGSFVNAHFTLSRKISSPLSLE